VVRPESCVELAGASPVRASAKTPGSWPQLRGVILGARARRQAVSGADETAWLEGAKLRSVTSSELCSAVTLKPERWKGRAGHGERRQQTVRTEFGEGALDFPGVWEMERNDSSTRNRRDPTWPSLDEGREKIASISLRTKGREVRRESEGVVVLEDKDNTTLSSPRGQGKGLYLSKASAQEVSARECL
jgi:hypothetical protein